MKLLPLSLTTSTSRQMTTVAATIIILFILFQSWILHPRQLLSTSSLPPPARVSDNIPKKIWYKLGQKGLSHDATIWTATCMELNPSWAVEFMTDETADAWVSTTFANRPDIVDAYLALQIPIIKADWLRYLLLYAEGGMWSDLDVSCNSPIETWIPPRFKNANISLVVGWEFDTAWPGTDKASVKHELATWTVLARPGSPHMWAAAEGVLRGLREVAAENGVGVEGITATPPMMGDIVTFCGPRRMTRSIFESLGRTQLGMLTGGEGAGVGDQAARAFEEAAWFAVEPTLVGDVLILPGYSFARTMNFYSEEVNAGLGPPLVEHHYAGSWKNDKGGEFL